MKMNKWDFLKILNMQKVVKKHFPKSPDIISYECVCFERSPYTKLAKVSAVCDTSCHTFYIHDPECSAEEKFNIFLDGIKKPGKEVTEVDVSFKDGMVLITYYHYLDAVSIQQVRTSKDSFMDTAKIFRKDKEPEATVSFGVKALQNLLTQYADDEYVTFKINTGRTGSFLNNKDGNKCSMILPYITY